MDPCAEFEADLELALETYNVTRRETFFRMFLRIIGFEWLYDLIFTAKKFSDLGWEDFFAALVALDLAAAIAFLIRNLRRLGFADVVKELLKKIGPWAILIWVVVLGVEIVSALLAIGDAKDTRDEEIRTAYQNASDCLERDAILTAHDVDIPR